MELPGREAEWLNLQGGTLLSQRVLASVACDGQVNVGACQGPAMA